MSVKRPSNLDSPVQQPPVSPSGPTPETHTPPHHLESGAKTGRPGPDLFADGVDKPGIESLGAGLSPSPVDAMVGRPQAVTGIDPQTRRTRAALVEALQHRPEALRDADPSLLEDRLFVLSLVRRAGALLEYLPAALKNDREIVRAAIERTPGAIEFASDALKADKELALLAVRLDGYSVTYLPPELKRDHDIGLAAVERSPWCLEYLDVTLRMDRDIVFAAASRNYDSIAFAHPSVLNDLPLMRELGRLNPLTLDALRAREAQGEATCLAELVRTSPELETARAQLQGRCQAAGIATPGRVGTLDTLEAILRGREHPERTDNRPLAVLVFPVDDYNRAFHNEAFAELTRHYRLLYYEANTDTDLVRSLKEATRNEPAALVMIGGHGAQESVAFGGEDPARRPQNPEESELDFSDRPELLAAHLEDVVLPGAPIVLKSCSTGKGTEGQKNVANLVANIFPEAHVYAPTRPDGGRIQLSPSGRFVGPGYHAGEFFTYHVLPAGAGR